MRLIDADELIEHAYRDRLDSRELIADMINNAPTVKEIPKFIAKADGTIEQIKDCEDCLFKKEWEKIGKLISVVLEKQTEQKINSDYISREKTLEKFCDYVGSGMSMNDFDALYDIVVKMPSVRPKADAEPKTGRWIFQKIAHGKRMWCSNCNSAFDLCCNQIKRYDEATKKDYLWTYCPWCGAKMEG